MTARMGTLLALATLLAPACGPEPEQSVEQRTFANPASGYRYVVPQGWKVYRGEVRSPEGALLTVQVKSLEGADPDFVRGLPETIYPQLEQWARHYYRVAEKVGEEPATISGRDGVEQRWNVRIREGDPPGQVIYWLAQAHERLYVLRASIPGRAAADLPGLREVVASWEFTTPTGYEDEDTGGVILAIPPRMDWSTPTPAPE